MKSKAIVIVLILVAAIGIFIYYMYREPMNITTQVNAGLNHNNAYEIKLIQKFEVPDELIEISGIGYLSKDHFVSIQDENGVIYIYKTDTESIIKEIKFGNDGDYEDLTLVGDDAYVIKSDGTLYQILNLQSDSPEMTQISISVGKGSDIEGLGYDKQQNRLLIGEKNQKKARGNVKKIYAFDLNAGKTTDEPAYQINTNDDIFKGIKDPIQPSGVAVHPATGEIYILEGKEPKLLILHNNGKPKSLYLLDKKIFPQPEGITFSPEGNLYISNEGNGNRKGNILEIAIIEKEL